MSKGQAWQEDGKPLGFDEPDLVELLEGSRRLKRRTNANLGTRLYTASLLRTALEPGKRHPATYALPLKPPGRRA